MRIEKNAAQPKGNEIKMEDILDRLERQANEAPTSEGRRERRWAYRRANLSTTVEHPGGGVTRLATQGVSLWSEGVSFLLSGFAYTGSACTVTLIAKDGESMVTKGTIVFCKHVEGLLHQAEAKFIKRIDPHLFVEPPRDAAGDSTAHVDLSNLHGKVLHLDDSDFDAKLLAHHLRDSAIELKSVKTAEEAIQILKTGTIDIFLCDFNLGGGSNSTATIAQARADGFGGPIVIISAENNPEKLSAPKAAGAHYVLEKPYQRNMLIQTMIKLHQEIGAIASGETLCSTLMDQPEMQELIAGYVQQTAEIAKQIDAAIASRNVSAVRELCLNIKGSAAGYGFAPLGTAAEEAIHGLDAAGHLDQPIPGLRMLTLMCRRLGVGGNNGKVKADKVA